MANLNLSEFTEKLFVADADHTFIWDTAASISKRVSRNSWLNSGTLTSDAPVTISQTWNNAAVAFTGLKVDATNTNSAAASKLFDLQVGGVSQTSFTKSGGLRFYTTGQFSGGNGFGFANSGFYSISSNGMFVVENGTARFEFGAQRFCLDPTTVLGWGTIGLTPDTILLRDGAANTLALRNGAAAQMFRVYGTYSDGTNYRRLAIGSFNNSEFDIQTEGAGGGTGGGPLNFGTAGARRMTITTAGNVGIGTTSPTSKLHVEGDSSPTLTIKNTSATGYSQVLLSNTVVPGSGFWVNGSAQANYGGASSFNIYAAASNIAFHTASVTNALSIAQNGTSTHAGQLIFAPDNTYDIGATNANRPRNVFAAGLLQAGATGVIGFNTRSYLKSPSDGVMTLVNTAETDFNRLQLGGAADTFPAIARDGAGIKFTGAAAGLTAWIKVPPVAVSALPLAATAGAGARAFVNDALSPTFGSAVTGGGSVPVPVYSTGSAWHVG